MVRRAGTALGVSGYGTVIEAGDWSLAVLTNQVGFVPRAGRQAARLLLLVVSTPLLLLFLPQRVTHPRPCRAHNNRS